MKKVAIVSCYFQPNYGSMLQALATQMVLDKLGYDNETVNISGLKKEINRAKVKYFFRASFSSGLLATKIGRAKDFVVRKFMKNEYTRNAHIRLNAFKEFEKKHFKLSIKYNSKLELGKSCPKNYQAVLVGSDQLWLPSNIAADYYTLNFVPNSVNTIAYATSFGQSNLPTDISRLASLFLKKIKHISVREESGQKLVKKLVDRKVPVVCDPTLLFTGEEWLKIQKEKPIIKEKYIFVYYLGSNEKHREFVKRLKDKTGLKVVILPHVDEYVKADEECADEKLYNIDPSEFLNLIRHAEYVCTDSFHCTVFSILYRKRFFTFRRFSDNNKQSTNSRLDTLFSITAIKGRLMNGNEDVSAYIGADVDYNTTFNNLEKIRANSYEYLTISLGNKRGTDL